MYFQIKLVIFIGNIALNFTVTMEHEIKIKERKF